MKPRSRIVNGPILTVLALGTVGLAGLWGNVRLIHERRALRTELATLRGEPLPIDSREEVAVATEITKLSGDLAEETALFQNAETKLAALQTTVPAVENEELRSFGHIEQMGLEAAEFLPMLADFTGRMKDGAADKLSGEESSRIIGEMMGWLNRLEAVGELEGNASEIARFHAATLQARLQLDLPTTEKVRQQVEREFGQLQSKNLARPQRPEADQDEWYRRRKRALDEATARIEALIPPSQRQPYLVGQSLYLGTGMRTQTQIGADGHGSIVMGLDLPGIDTKR
jgi:hypothetical protein